MSRRLHRPPQLLSPFLPPTTTSSASCDSSRYRPLFSGPIVERVRELEFQRPAAEIELAHEDAERREIANGDLLDVRSNGTLVRLRARIDRKLMPGVVRIAEEHAGDLHPTVEVLKT